MLKKLSIQNFAIIDQLEVHFLNGFTAITGETGAGKSILLGALGLVLGKRADSSVLLDHAKKCIVEVEFDTHSYQGVKEWLQKQQEEETELVILRREINNAGKSRAFINDSPINLNQLKELTSLLVDLHQQFDTLELKEESFQREILDALCNNTEQVQSYHKQFNIYLSLKKQLQDLKEEQLRAGKEREYFQFQLNELEQLQLKPGELEELEQELKLLNSSEEVTLVLKEAVQLLIESETPLVNQLKQLVNRLQGYKDLLPALQPLTERIKSAQIELDDIGSELSNLQDIVLFDEQRIRFINDRLEPGYKLLKKHGVRSTNDLLKIQEELALQLQKELNQLDEINKREKELEQLQQSLEKWAEAIHVKRKEVQPSLEKSTVKLLQQVGMPNARLRVNLKEGVLNAHGKDEIDFLFDANKSNRFESIDKVASGGELSRLMLCIKSLVAANTQLPTMVFDEIDTGISGEAARQVGLLLQQLSKNHQVIVITHLPQIAAKATTHFFVYKEQFANGVKTKIKVLNRQEQIQTIAQMLSGETASESAINTAKEMVTG
jgi:DNA repair protein RecN (Recombination protein N)